MQLVAPSCDFPDDFLNPKMGQWTDLPTKIIRAQLNYTKYKKFLILRHMFHC